MSDTQVVEANPAEMPADAVLEQAEPGSSPTEGATQEKETREPRVYSEEEHKEALERATAKAAAKAERRAYREALNARPQQQQVEQPQADQKPTRANGESDDSYLDRLTDWKLGQRDRVAAQEKAQTEQRKLAERTEKIYAEAEKLAGFDREDFNDVMQSASFTREFAQALIDSDAAPKLMHFLAGNPDEAKRIGGLSAARQAAELGKLEARLSTTTVTPSKAPRPIDPVGNRGSITQDPEKMSMAEYEKWRESQGARMRKHLAR